MKNLMIITVAALSILSVACGSSAPAPQGDAPTREARVGDTIVRSYTSAPDGFATNSHWVETEEGVIVFDAQFLPEYAEALLDEIGASTSQPVTDVVVLHANPDKYNGLAVFQERFPDARVWSTAEIVSRIEEVDPGKRAYFEPQYNERYPARLVLPGELVSSRTRIERGGVSVELIPMGAGVSTAHLVARVEGTGEVIVGDLLHNEVHGWLAEGFSDRWLDRLDELAGLEPTVLYGGRGVSGGPELIEAQRVYIEGFQGCVGEFAGQELDEQASARIKECVVGKFGSYQIDVMIDFSVPGEHARQSAKAD